MPYAPGLDGLRAIAVMAVLLYHGEVSWLQGGYLGVEVFFVISGYLITALLLQEHAQHGGINRRRFWIRRARRLLPALYALLVGVVVLAALVATDALDGLGREIVGALFYVTNWQLIFTDQSYFESFGRPSPLRHLWSLAIEEQFYVVWPLLMIWGLRRLGRSRLLLAIGLGILASTTLMWALYEPFTDPSRVYYGTDTRAAGPLVGAALAFVWQPWNVRRVWVRDRGPLARILDGTGIVALLALGWLFVSLLETDDFLYQGGFLLTSTITALVIAATMVPTGRFGSWLGVAPLRWLGLRSYAIYLWHWPIFVFSRPRLDTTLDGFSLLCVRLALTLMAAEVSYRLIEEPLRNQSFGRDARAFMGRLRAGDAAARRTAVLNGARLALVPITLVALQSSALADDAEPVEVAGTVEERTSAPVPTTVPEPVIVGPGTVAIGDSVMTGAADALAARLPAMEIDADIGRQWWTVADDVQIELRAADTVIVHLGNNGAPSSNMVDDLVTSMADDARIVLLTVRAPVRWEGRVNNSLREAAERWPNVEVAEWKALSDEQWSWFESDGVHLTTEGETAYVDLIVRSVRGTT